MEDNNITIESKVSDQSHHNNNEHPHLTETTSGTTFFDEYFEQPYDSEIAAPSKPKHIKVPTTTSIFSRQSSITSLEEIIPNEIKIEHLSPSSAKHLGFLNFCVELVEKASTPTLLFLMLCHFGINHLYGIWLGLPAAIFATLPIAMTAFLFFKGDVKKGCSKAMTMLTKLLLITGLTLALTTAAYSLSLNYLNSFNVPWHLLLSSFIAVIFFSVSVAYTQYILISHKAKIKSDLEIEEDHIQQAYYEIFDKLPTKQKLNSIVFFWSAFVEALSISFLTYTFFVKMGWVNLYDTLNTVLWISIACIALSRFIKVVNSDAAESEKIINYQVPKSILELKYYKINKYTTAKYLDGLFAKIIQMFSYRLTPMVENTTNWIALFVLYYDIKQMPELNHLTQLEFKIIFSAYLLITILALSGEYFFEFAADRKWTRTNANYKYASVHQPLQWRASPSVYGRALLSILSIPMFFYYAITKISTCQYDSKTAKKIFYRTSMVSKSLGHSAILGVVALESYALIFNKYPDLKLTLILLGIALTLGVIKGYGECRARKLEGKNLSDIIVDQLIKPIELIPSNEVSIEEKNHQYQNSDMSQIIKTLDAKREKIYEGLHLPDNQLLVLGKFEALFFVLWISISSIVSLHYFKWIDLPYNIYLGGIILSATLSVAILLYQIKDSCCRTEENPHLSYAFSSSQDNRKTKHSLEKPTSYGRDAFSNKLHRTSSDRLSSRFKQSPHKQTLIVTPTDTDALFIEQCIDSTIPNLTTHSSAVMNQTNDEENKCDISQSPK